MTKEVSEGRLRRQWLLLLLFNLLNKPRFTLPLNVSNNRLNLSNSNHSHKVGRNLPSNSSQHKTG
jgi:hypothetical protein